MKKYLTSFITLAILVFIARHIIADIRQEDRIEVLENLVNQLYQQKSDTIYYHESSQPSETRRTETKKKRSAIINTTANITEGTKPEESAKALIFRNSTKKDTHKFSNPITIDLNKADSALLTRVPGIGAKSASMIIRYRERLGGFYNPYQISEILNWESAQTMLDEWCTQWFIADETLIKHIDINHADFKEILRHPYLNYEQTKALCRYRDNHYCIENIESLQMIEEITEEDIAKLKHYLIFLP